MQIPFLQYCRDCKDVLFCRVAFENTTSRVIVLEADQLWLPNLQKLLVCIVRKVVLRSHPMKCQHTPRKSHTYYPDSKNP